MTKLLVNAATALKTGESKSKAFSLDGTDLWKLFIGSLIVAAGAGLTTISEGVEGIDFGIWTPVVLVAATTLVNLARKFLTENKPS